MVSAAPLGWPGIIRLGLVQSSLGAVVVLTTSTLNRVMVVELMLPALVPGLLVALHHVIQLLRPRFGYGSDVGGRRTPWIIGGMAVLCAGGLLAAVATSMIPSYPGLGLALALVGFAAVGVGVGAAGTSLLVLLAKRVQPERRAAAATTVWIMMIAGFVLTAGVAGALLEPFSLPRMVAVSAGVVGIAWLVATLAVWGVEGDAPAVPTEPEAMPAFGTALREVWAETRARRLTVFIFVSMLAYSAQDLILEPFAGSIFGLTPGQSTQLSGIQNAGVLLGMLLVAGLARSGAGRGLGSLTAWCVGGCLASGVALFGLSVAGYLPGSWPLAPSVFALGAANGAFSVAAIGSMMAMVAEGARAREGVRMGLWGAAQAIAFAAGGIAGTGLVDLIRLVSGSALTAYSMVFFLEGLVFLVAAYLARHIGPSTGAAQARSWVAREAVTVSAGGR